MSTFGFFTKLPSGDRYRLTQVVSSPYETEREDGDTLVRELNKFAGSDFDIMEYVENDHIRMLSFGTDNTVVLRDDFESVEVIEGMKDDPVDGMNMVKIEIDDRTLRANFGDDLAKQMLRAYPEGYTAPAKAKSKSKKK